MSFDIERARRETPGVEHVLHFNNAGSSLPPRQVLDAQIDHLRLEAQIGGYEAADVARDRVERVYSAAAEMIGARPDEIAIIENATRAWDMAFYSIPFEPGDRILTAVAEYGSNFIPYLQVAEKHGVIVDVVPNDETGQLSVEALKNMMDDQVKLISITHVPTNGGLVNPAEEIGKVAKEASVLYLIDACQSVAQLPMHVDAINCDMLSTTGRKYIRGPRGTGFLYVRRGVLDQLEPPLIDHHAANWVARDRYELRNDAKRFENWETNYASKIGLGVALDYALNWTMDDIWVRIQDLADDLRSKLAALPRVTVQDLGVVRCGIVTFTVDGANLPDIKSKLAEHRINVSVSNAPSTRLDMDARGIDALIRSSVHYYNSEEEIDRFVDTLESII